MDSKQIENSLINYGVYPKAKGFEMTTKLIEYVLNDESDKINLHKYYLKLADEYCLSYETIKASIRYVVTTKNSFGGNLTIKNLINAIKMKKL